MRRILMINDHIHFGGGGDAAFRIEKQAYEDRGHRVFTFSQSANEIEDLNDMDYVAVESDSRLARKVGKFFYSKNVAAKFSAVLDSVRPDFVSAHLISKYPMSIYPQLGNVPVVQTLHGPNLFCATSWGNQKNGDACEMGVGMKCFTRGCTSLSTAALYSSLYSRLLKYVKNNVDLFVCPSAHLRDSALSLGFTPAEFAPLGIDKQFESEPSLERDGVPKVLFVGALVEQKGIDILIDAFTHVVAKVPNAELVVAGRGPMSGALAQQVVDGGIEKNVTFLGFVEHSEIAKLYREVHVLAVPSIWKEQFGLVGPEALACGTPAVGSNIGGIPEWLRDGEWGFLVPPRDSGVLAEKIIALLENADLRRKFGARGRAWAIEQYSSDKYRDYRLHLVRKYLRG